jgi:hypothetical protein
MDAMVACQSDDSVERIRGHQRDRPANGKTFAASAGRSPCNRRGRQSECWSAQCARPMGRDRRGGCADPAPHRVTGSPRSRVQIVSGSVRPFIGISKPSFEPAAHHLAKSAQGAPRCGRKLGRRVAGLPAQRSAGHTLGATRIAGCGAGESMGEALREQTVVALGAARAASRASAAPWAATRTDLRIARFALRERESGSSKREPAVAAYREVRKQEPRERLLLE